MSFFTAEKETLVEQNKEWKKKGGTFMYDDWFLSLVH